MSGIVFGPVPSRRLGRSLGVNNIPPKHCSYSCVYCQAGRTVSLEVRRRAFYDPEAVAREVEAAVAKLEKPPDFITFVPDGEPTLDINLGREISDVRRRTGIRVAVLTNSSLLFMEDVRGDLGEADLVSLKVDAVSERVWKKVNRPHASLRLDDVLNGIREFAREYHGEIITETMLVKGINDSREDIEGVAAFLSEISPCKAYIAIPIRPPAESWVEPASEEVLNEAYQVFKSKLGGRVELLIGYEGADFEGAGPPREAILSILSVHPMREDYAESLLKRMGVKPDAVISGLIEEGLVKRVRYRGHTFLMRKLKRKWD